MALGAPIDCLVARYPTRTGRSAPLGRSSEAALADHALGLAEAGQLADAEALMAQLSEESSEDPLFPLLLGTLRAKLGDHVGAVVAYDESLERHVLHGGKARFEGELRLLRARSLILCGREREAQVDLFLAAASPDTNVARGAQAILTRRDDA